MREGGRDRQRVLEQALWAQRGKVQGAGKCEMGKRGYEFLLLSIFKS